MERLRGIEVLVKVVEMGSFSGAARELGASKSWVSKEVARLEDRLGVRLLERTTRKMRLTEVGANYYQMCADLLEGLQEAEDVVVQARHSPRGILRASIPVSFGVRRVAPLIGALLQQCPDLRVDLRFSDHRVDLLDGGFDLAIRVGQLEDSSLRARRLMLSRSVVVASPSYLDKRGVPASPEDLTHHEALLYGHQQTGASWVLHGPQDDHVTVRVSGRFTADNGDAILEAAAVGLGCAHLPEFIVAQALKTGQVLRVLPEWSNALPVWALTPPGRHLPPKVRVFVETVAQALQQEPGEVGTVVA